MHASLNMCIELDNAGELAENLTILTKEEWLSQHYNKNEEKEEEKISKTIGTVKSKRKYEHTV